MIDMIIATPVLYKRARSLVYTSEQHLRKISSMMTTMRKRIPVQSLRGKNGEVNERKRTGKCQHIRLRDSIDEQHH